MDLEELCTHAGVPGPASRHDRLHVVSKFTSGPPPVHTFGRMPWDGAGTQMTQLSLSGYRDFIDQDGRWRLSTCAPARVEVGWGVFPSVEHALAASFAAFTGRPELAERLAVGGDLGVVEKDVAIDARGTAKQRDSWCSTCLAAVVREALIARARTDEAFCAALQLTGDALLLHSSSGTNVTRSAYKDLYVSSMLMEIRSGLPPLRTNRAALDEDEDEDEDG